MSKVEKLAMEDIIHSFIVKHEGWRHEREWRLVVDKRYLNEKKFDIKDCASGFTLKIPEELISSITLGCNCTEDNGRKIRKIAKNRGIKVYTTKKCSDRYGLKVIS